MFRLLRYFSLTSLASMLIASLLLGVLYREIAVRSMITMGEASNHALTRTLSNALQVHLKSYLDIAAGLPDDRLREHSGHTALSKEMRGLLSGLDVVRVKLYDLQGRTVFSTDPSQIGENESDDEGFMIARDGHVASELLHRDQFGAFEHVVEDRDLLSSYIPLRDGDRVMAVFELYDDLTPYLARIQRMQRIVVGGVLAVMALLYGVLFLIVRRGANIIQRQYHEREAVEAALRDSQQMLECRVAERTAALETANAELEAEMAERRLADQRMTHMAYHDALTGLPNRALLNDRIAHDITRARRDSHMLAVLLLDLDRFKNVNDSLGHEAGDALLKVVAERLRGRLRECDTIGRLGGDEFVICLPDIGSAEEAGAVAAAILAELSADFQVDGHELHVDASAGIALFPRDGDDVETLIRNADAAMYHAKEAGRANHQFFTEQISERVSRRLSAERGMRRALEREEFHLHYQPLVDLASGEIIGAEALMRWPQGDQRFLSPAEFIPVAEDTGLILPLGEWALRQACMQAQQWQVDKPGLRIAVNISALQFRQEGFVDVVEGTLASTGLASSLLELELTEGILMDNVDETLRTLERLKIMGVRLAVDDFGTGYSSLSYLKRFPIHTLKIDRSLVRDIGTDPDDAAIVTAVIFMARSLRLSVTAEGVETVQQADFLRSLDCDVVQGFLFAKPMPADAFSQRLSGAATPIAA